MSFTNPIRPLLSLARALCWLTMNHRTAIYFPIVVVFLAATQGITPTPADYIVICLLSTLASIGTTPIPSSSLVLVVMIAGSINVPITGMYAVVVAIDWFLDRFRTAVNVSGDLFAAVVMQKITGITDDDDSITPADVTESDIGGRGVAERV
jgi:Na+/H+-dicarboxylate symporter